MVGAGAPPGNTHGRDHGAARSRLAFSNYGLCVDAQGWGAEVTTLGYGDLQGGDESIWYTDVFGGTSAAAAIVAGVITSLQGVNLNGAKRAPLTPADARNALRVSGTPQQDGANPSTQRIGSLPELPALIALLPPQKSEAKDGKDTKNEGKDNKDNKDGKDNKDNPDKLQKDNKDHKDDKDGKDRKDHKDDKGDKVETQKELKDFGREKEFTDLPNRADVMPAPAAWPVVSTDPVQHFIPAEHRPDLATAALRDEPDVTAVTCGSSPARTPTSTPRRRGDRLRSLGLTPLEVVKASELVHGAGWEHRVDSRGAWTRLVLADGRVIDTSDVRGVLNRLLWVSAEGYARGLGGRPRVRGRRALRARPELAGARSGGG